MKKRQQNGYKFEQAGAVERDLAKKLAKILDCQFVPAPQLCNYDCVFEKNGIISIVECKVRTFEHDRYDTCLIERPKHEKLLSFLYNNQCHKVLYIMFYSNNVALVWNLANHQEPMWHEGEFVKTTMGDRTGKQKTVAYLNVKDARMIDLKQKPKQNENNGPRGTSLF